MICNEFIGQLTEEIRKLFTKSMEQVARYCEILVPCTGPYSCSKCIIEPHNTSVTFILIFEIMFNYTIHI